MKNLKIAALVVFILLMAGYGVYRFLWLSPYLKVENNVIQYLIKEKDYEREDFELVDRKFTKSGYKGIRIGMEFQNESGVVYEYLQLGDGSIEQASINDTSSTEGNYKHFDENRTFIDRNEQ